MEKKVNNLFGVLNMRLPSYTSEFSYRNLVTVNDERFASRIVHNATDRTPSFEHRTIHEIVIQFGREYRRSKSHQNERLE